jgi:DNA polymerase-4
MTIQRKIIHIDMDCFYAAVEQRDNPELKGKPLVVGGNPHKRGVVSTASYEARKFGVKSAMSCVKALQLCPDAIFVYPRFHAYKEASRHIRAIFYRYTDLIEPLSLDEAFLDVTENKMNINSALKIAKEIKEAIKSELNLTASAGVSVNKFLAKVASDMQKPDGLTFIGPERVVSFIEELPIEKFFGVGKVTAQRMHTLGISTGMDLKLLTKEQLLAYFGKVGNFYYNIVRGIDNRPVNNDREHKSMASENTFTTDTTEIEFLHKELLTECENVIRRMKKYNLWGRTITLKVKFSDFKQITRSKTCAEPVKKSEQLFKIASELLVQGIEKNKLIRLIGVSASNFEETAPIVKPLKNPSQLSLF